MLQELKKALSSQIILIKPSFLLLLLLNPASKVLISALQPWLDLQEQRPWREESSMAKVVAPLHSMEASHNLKKLDRKTYQVGIY